MGDVMGRIQHGGLGSAERDRKTWTKMNKASCYINNKMVDFELLKLGCSYRFIWSKLYIDSTT